jgi:hypothetical protein
MSYSTTTKQYNYGMGKENSNYSKTITSQRNTVLVSENDYKFAGFPFSGKVLANS